MRRKRSKMYWRERAMIAEMERDAWIDVATCKPWQFPEAQARVEEVAKIRRKFERETR